MCLAAALPQGAEVSFSTSLLRVPVGGGAAHTSEVDGFAHGEVAHNPLRVPEAVQRLPLLRIEMGVAVGALEQGFGFDYLHYSAIGHGSDLHLLQG